VDETWRSSIRRLIRVQNNEQVKVSREDQSADYSEAPVVVQLQPVEHIEIDIDSWEARLGRLSELLLQYPVQSSNITLHVDDRVFYVLNTEGTRVRHQRVLVRLSVQASMVAEDGMYLEVYESLDSHSLEGIPGEEELAEVVHATGRALQALSQAPVVEPYAGPAILRGRAAAVFFHEILGHRVEGHRQKDEDEGQTLKDKVGEAIFPDFIDVVDDPSLRVLGGTELNGYYPFDDEGVAGERVSLVEDGVLKGFLMSRAPIEGYGQSNGHGRRQAGEAIVSRQGNLMVIAEEARRSPDELREDLIAEIKAQGKPFGLIFDDITGGFTFTGRSTPNSYAVQPVMVWRVYPDGRPDELVRGVDLIGTPLATFSRILAASDTVSVFNGMCGAESGWVPVSASAPDLLVSEVEIQRKEKGQDRPPLLPAPEKEGP
jgi:predicted Zn-dependent protease